LRCAGSGGRLVTEAAAGPQCDAPSPKRAAREGAVQKDGDCDGDGDGDEGEEEEGEEEGEGEEEEEKEKEEEEEYFHN
jgi:hypothetical protein